MIIKTIGGTFDNIIVLFSNNVNKKEVVVIRFSDKTDVWFLVEIQIKFISQYTNKLFPNVHNF